MGLTKKKIISIITVIVILLTTAFCAWAHLTDYASASFSSVAGTLDIMLTENMDLDGDLGILNPGDESDLSFTITNVGEKSVDLKYEIIIYSTDNSGTTTLNMTEGNFTTFRTQTEINYEFDHHVYKIVDDEGKEYFYTNDESDTNKVIYTFGDPSDPNNNTDMNNNGDFITLDGRKENDEDIEGVTDTYTANINHTFVMDLIALNDWEGTRVYIAVNVYAKQHRNTGANWGLIKTYEPVNGSVNGEWLYDVLPSGEIQLTEYVGSDTEITIPATYGGYDVYSVGVSNADSSSYKSVFGSTDSTANTTITSVEFEDGIEVIEKGAFYNCTALTGDLVIPNSVTEIGNGAFRFCSGLNGTLTLSNSLVTIDDYAFDRCTKFTGNLVIPNTVTTIGMRAFQKCEKFTGTLTLPTSLVSIGDAAFNHCTAFQNTSLTIPATVTRIGLEETGYSTHVFYNFATMTLKEYKVEDGNTVFESVDGVIYSKDHTRLVQYPPNKEGNYVILDGVTQIDELAFSRTGHSSYSGSPNCLKKLTLPDSFVLSTELPSNCMNIGNNLSVALYLYTSVNEIFVNDTNPNYTTVDGILYSKDMTTLWYVPVAKTGDIVIPEGVTTIKHGALFDEADWWGNYIRQHTSVTIPSTVTDIDSAAITELQFLANKGKLTFAEGCVYQLDGNNKIVKN